MNFTGIDPSTLLRAGAALAAVVVVFYILKLRRRPIAVPFGPLWQKVLRDKEATSLFSQLKRLLSLLLQLALLALLLLALGDPRPAVNESDGRHVVVLIDGSASMKAIDGDGLPAFDAQADDTPATTRLDAGKEKIREVIRGLGGSDRMLIAQLDAAVTPLSTMTGEVSDLEEALDAVRALDVRADYARGLRFAVDSLTGLSSPEIIVVSDGALGEPSDGLGPVDIGDAKLSYLKVGNGSRNVAISGFSVRRYPLDKSRYEVLLEVINTSAEPADVDLELYGDGELTDIVSLRLEGEETLSRFYPNLSGADKTLEARIRLKNDRDLLPADDHAYALLPERRRARVQVVTSGNMYLEAALLLDEYLEVTTVAPAEFPAPGAFDVTIFDGVTRPLVAEAGHVLYLNPDDDKHTPFKLKDEIKSDKRYTLGFDEIDDKHPIVRHVVLGDINIARGRALEGGEDAKAVAKSFKGTLLLSGRSAGRKYVALGFDIRESDLPLRVAWPLLLLNTINSFIEEDSDYISSYTTGDVWSIPASAGLETARLELPSGDSVRIPIKNGRAVFLGQEAGFYELVLAEGEESIMFAANLSNPLESAIAPADSLAVGERASDEVSGFEIGVRHEYWIYLLALVLAVTAIEWLTYHRRLTV
jgi:Ca-activated chloride channel homolog